MSENQLIIDGLQRIEERLTRHEDLSAKRHEHLDHIIRGNGTPGVVTRLDRLEQRSALIAWLVKGLGVAVLGQIVVWAFGLTKG